jgi:hypothetical protein
MRLGADWRALLRGAGQPQQRTRAWSWCMRGARNAEATDVAELSRAGKVEQVGSTAHGRRAGDVRVAASAHAVRRLRSAGGGVRLRRTARSTWVYAVSGGRVRAVGVASNALAARPAQLRAAMHRLLAAKASRQKREFRPSAAQAATRGRLTGQTLAGTADPGLNSALALLCSLQLPALAAR